MGFNDLNALLESAMLSALGTQLGTQLAPSFKSIADGETVLPRIVVSAAGGEEDPPDTGNYYMRGVVTVCSSADAGRTSHAELCHASFAVFYNENLANTLNLATENFCCMGVRALRTGGTVFLDTHWQTRLEFEAYCCASDDIPQDTGAVDPPDAPSNLVATAVSSSEIDLTWQDNSSVETGFILQRKSGVGGTYAQIATPATGVQSYQDIGLDVETTYYYRILAVGEGGNSPWSNEASETTQGPVEFAPVAPSDLTAVAVSAYAINLAWTDNSDNETGFEVWRKLGVAGSYGLIATTAANAEAYQSTGLIPAGTYYFKVRAINAVGNSDYTAEASDTTDDVAPVAPSDLTASGVSSSAIDLAWTDNGTNETGYQVQRKLGTGAWTVIATTAADAEAYQSTGLGHLAVYAYTVRAASAWGYSAFSGTAYGTTFDVVPAAPSNLTAVAASGSVINLAWTDNGTNETHFQVERKTTGAFAFIGTAVSNATSYANTGLAEDTIYYYQVRAVNAVGNSAYSGTASATTPKTEAGESSLLTGLTAYWKLDEESGNRSASVGGYTLTDWNTVGYTTGKVEKAASFVASNQEVLYCADAAGLRGGNNDWTRAFWFNKTSNVAYQSPLAKRADSHDNTDFLFWFNPVNTLALYVGCVEENTYLIVTSSVSTPANEWHLAIAWVDKTAGKIYLQIDNNTPDELALTATPTESAARFIIGAGEYAGGAFGYFFNGAVDELGFWSRVLTAPERTALYNSGNGVTHPFS